MLAYACCILVSIRYILPNNGMNGMNYYLNVGEFAFQPNYTNVDKKYFSPSLPICSIQNTYFCNIAVFFANIFSVRLIFLYERDFIANFPKVSQYLSTACISFEVFKINALVA